MSDATGCAVRPVVVVPVKRLADAKSRLASDLEPRVRGELVVAMLEDVLAAVRATYDGPLMVLSPEDEYEPIASRYHAEWERDGGTGYNEAICHAASTPSVAVAGAMLVLPADLPGAQPADIARLIEAVATAEVVVAPAFDGGTAALGLRPPGVIAPAFGPDSARRHRDAALAAGVRLAALECPSLEHDIDRLALLVEAPPFEPGPATRRFLERHSSKIAKGRRE